MKQAMGAATAVSGTAGAKLALLDRAIRRLVFQRLSQIRHGQLTIIDDDGSHGFGNSSTHVDDLAVTVRIHSGYVYRRLVLRGSIGVGESYVAGEWQCDDLTKLVRIFALNKRVTDSLEQGVACLAMVLFRVAHALRRNNRLKSRQNIAAHYDLGNEFYRLFLDETMMYSSAIFPSYEASLHQASLHKLDRICQKLQLKPVDHLLEIGTGWGGLAIHAAKHYGCRVTTTTISQQQYHYACEQVRTAGLSDKITVLQRDYRDLQGHFDKLVSVEMIEAVGHSFLDTYFRTCSRLLKDNGVMLLQAITIADQEYERAKRAVDFIQKYIFPGGFIPSVAAISNTLAKASDLRLFHLEDIGPHYALTLRHWRQRFFSNIDQVREQGFSDSFIRMWEFYLCYCEGGFAERAIGTAQILLVKPMCRRESLLAAIESH